MKDKWTQMMGQLEQLKNWAKKKLNEIIGSKSPSPANNREVTMNIKWNHIAGQWTLFRSQAKEQWGELTDKELIEVNGRFEVLAEKIQERYGIERAEAKQQIDTWTANLSI
jgi:uncharacterized protein YjbJ (UPF0337 family)